MKKQGSTILHSLHSFRSMAVALVFYWLLVTSSYLAYSQDQGEAERTEPVRAAQPQIGVTNSSQNPLQIAILHWYNANLTTQFTTGTEPSGVAFDGASIWVCNN